MSINEVAVPEYIEHCETGVPGKMIQTPITCQAQYVGVLSSVIAYWEFNDCFFV